LDGLDEMVTALEKVKLILKSINLGSAAVCAYLVQKCKNKFKGKENEFSDSKYRSPVPINYIYNRHVYVN